MSTLLYNHPQYLAIYVAIMSLVAFGAMGLDKRAAQAGARRVPERTLLLLALAGGSLGSILGMNTFRHKTRHWQFKFGLPAILIAQVALLSWLALG